MFFCAVCFPPVSVQYSSQFLESHSITVFFCNPASLGLVFFFTFVYNDNGVHLKIVRREFFRFRLKARNGEIIAASEGYKAKVSCINGMESVTKHAPNAEIMDEVTE